jgi:hypothetical protein
VKGVILPASFGTPLGVHEVVCENKKGTRLDGNTASTADGDDLSEVRLAFATTSKRVQGKVSEVKDDKQQVNEIIVGRVRGRT